MVSESGSVDWKVYVYSVLVKPEVGPEMSGSVGAELVGVALQATLTWPGAPAPPVLAADGAAPRLPTVMFTAEPGVRSPAEYVFLL